MVGVAHHDMACQNRKHDCMLKFPLIYLCNNVYKGTTFSGYVGLMTGMIPDKLTMSLDQQNKGDWQENAFEIVYIYACTFIVYFIVYSTSLTTYENITIQSSHPYNLYSI